LIDSRIYPYIKRHAALDKGKRCKLFLTTVIFTLILQLTAKAPLSASDYLHITDSGFTNLPTSVRAMGMGQAFVAIADDYGACYFNPAGLLQITQKELGTIYTDLYGLGLLKQSFLSFIDPTTGMGAGGISWSRLSADLEPEKWNCDLYSYSYAQFLFQDKLTTSRKTFSSWGINIKYLKETSPWGNASGYSLDAGFLARGEKFSWGANIQDLISQISWTTGRKESIPTNIKLGTVYRFTPHLLTALDIDASWQDLPKNIRLGSEWWVQRNIALRLGAVKTFQKNADLTFSAGLGLYFPFQNKKVISTIAFNYALSSRQNLSTTHYFSLSFGF